MHSPDRYHCFAVPGGAAGAAALADDAVKNPSCSAHTALAASDRGLCTDAREPRYA